MPEPDCKLAAAKASQLHQVQVADTARRLCTPFPWRPVAAIVTSAERQHRCARNVATPVTQGAVARLRLILLSIRNRERGVKAFRSSFRRSLHQEQSSQLTLRVQEGEMLPMDFSALCNHGLTAYLGWFEPDSVILVGHFEPWYQPNKFGADSATSKTNSRLSPSQKGSQTPV